jgi:pyrroloquinoline-quinone synthase
VSAETAPDLELRLRRILAERYHDRHPFNLRMHAGTLRPGELRTWVRNRYYYQTRIPIKDGIILAKAESPAFRREWVRRIHDHDGERPGEGGLEQWLALAEAVGLERAEVESLRLVLPGVRQACDDYVRFVESNDLLASVAASLTEMSAGTIMQARLAAFEAHYPWVAESGLRYFRSRTTLAPRDAEGGLRFVLEHAMAPEDQDRCVRALERKCEILWRLLDAVEAAHARPRLAGSASLRFDAVEGRDVAVLPERAVKLNASGREILDLCDGERCCEEIASALRARHPEIDDLESDVHDFIGHMRRLGVLEVST